MIPKPWALLPLLLLAGCLPLPQGVPERLTPSYTGKEPGSVSMNCAQQHESIWIQGPDAVQLRITPLYQPPQGLAVLKFRLVSTGQHRVVSIPSQNLAVEPFTGGPSYALPLQGGTARALTMADPQREPIKELELELLIRDIPQEGIRLQLPQVFADEVTWQPQLLELRRSAPTLRFTPFNC
jgi:hypothetical protein